MRGKGGEEEGKDRREDEGKGRREDEGKMGKIGEKMKGKGGEEEGKTRREGEGEGRRGNIGEKMRGKEERKRGKIGEMRGKEERKRGKGGEWKVIILVISCFAFRVSGSIPDPVRTQSPSDYVLILHKHTERSQYERWRLSLQRLNRIY